MPKIEGRESTKREFALGRLEIGSFVMEHETRYWRHVCCVKGCDHRMGPKTDEPGWTNWEPCSREALPAFVYDTKSDRLKSAGMVCPCHAAEILNGPEVP